MKLFLRFALPLFISICLIAYAVVPLVDTLTLRWFARDIEIRSNLILSTLYEPVVDLIKDNNKKKIESIFKKAIQDERLYAIALCNNKGSFFVKTVTFPDEIKCPVSDDSSIESLSTGKVHITASNLYDSDKILQGKIILVHDMSFIERRSEVTKKYVLYLFAVIGILISLIAVLIAKFSIWGWLRTFKQILKGDLLIDPSQHSPSEFRPFFKDLRLLMTEMEKEKRYRDDGRLTWTPKTIKEILNKELLGDEVLIVSNREPYIHTRNGDQVEVQFPASGVVTALEPIMRACSGTWIAHGSGNADKEFVDKNDIVHVPPENPKYKLKRVWLSPEEEKGYYYGFSNEGLWPLCHIAHVRPIFRLQDWETYSKVNKKFAEIVAKEAKTDNPVILIQDYHFALLPKMIKDLLPKATIIMFWHIPWPNPESFGICPWKDEILEGLLGSSILGFHTTYHCNNFIDTVDRYLECRIDRSSSTISFKGKLTEVNNYPISISPEVSTPSDSLTREHLLAHLNLTPESAKGVKLGIGVDRLDYTKGIIERFLSVESFFKKNPKWIGKFSFIQIAAPSRSSIEEYKRFSDSVFALADKINKTYATGNWSPIIFLPTHHTKEFINEYYKMADVCFVSSLHDGMNLVAKEYISQREKENGVLILSQFTGAAMELPEALIVNPYDIELCADAIKLALEMPEAEQKERMKSLKAYVTEFNVYRWAGRMLIDSARMRRREKIIRTKI